LRKIGSRISIPPRIFLIVIPAKAGMTIGESIAGMRIGRGDGITH